MTNSNYLLRIVFVLTILLFQKIHAQNSNDCGSIFNSESMDYYESIKSEIEQLAQEFLVNKELQRSSSALISIPVKAHIIRTSLGTGGLSISELNDAMAVMNSYYANANLQFYLCDGINYIDDDNYYDYETSEETDLTNANNVNGLINIYFTDSITSTDSGNGLCGYAYYPGGPDTILMANNCATNGSTLAHEMGHFFFLLHTHGSTNGELTDELVDGSNCSASGDFVCDTPADPQLSYSNVNASCNYIDNVTDSNGDFFNPDPSNIMSYSRKSCRNYFSPEQYARIYATYLVSRSGYDCGSFNVDFIANNNQTCQNSLTVNFTDNSVGATAWQWDVDGDDLIDYTTQNPSHVYSTNGVYDVALTISNGVEEISKVNFDFIQIGALETLPIDQDFNSIDNANSGNWTASSITNGSSYKWVAASDGTPSDETGPLGDNSTLGDGIFIYTEATGSNGGDRADYISPCIEINSANALLQFAYHMYGTDMGELHVDIDNGSGFVNDVLPALIGQQQTNQTDAYNNVSLNLSAYNGQSIKVRFRAIRGIGFTSDIAIDDFKILSTTLSSNEFNKAKIKLYPNPVDNDILNLAYSDNLNLDFEIVNLLGQQIVKGEIIGRQIDVSLLKSGTYFLILNSENQQVVKKFIKL